MFKITLAYSFPHGQIKNYGIEGFLLLMWFSSVGARSSGLALRLISDIHLVYVLNDENVCVLDNNFK